MTLFVHTEITPFFCTTVMDFSLIVITIIMVIWTQGNEKEMKRPLVPPSKTYLLHSCQNTGE